MQVDTVSETGRLHWRNFQGSEKIEGRFEFSFIVDPVMGQHSMDRAVTVSAVVRDRVLL